MASLSLRRLYGDVACRLRKRGEPESLSLEQTELDTPINFTPPDYGEKRR